jgi:polyhydroxyalkanoate synthase
MGLLPMEVLQSAFWSLDPARTVTKFERFAELDPRSSNARAFIALEDWANDGPPIPEAAAAEMFEALFAEDRTGLGEWRVGGEAVDPARLPCPLFNIVSTSDRIVPHATAIRTGERLDLDQGHVGMVVGGRAMDSLWQPLAAWLSRAAVSC